MIKEASFLPEEIASQAAAMDANHSPDIEDNREIVDGQKAVEEPVKDQDSNLESVENDESVTTKDSLGPVEDRLLIRHESPEISKAPETAELSQSESAEAKTGEKTTQNPAEESLNQSPQKLPSKPDVVQSLFRQYMAAKPETASPSTPIGPSKRSGRRLMLGLAANIRGACGGRGLRNVRGLDRFFNYFNQKDDGKSFQTKLPPTVVTTHLTDIDVQATALAIGKSCDVALGSAASNQKNPFLRGLQGLVGKQHFFDVDNQVDDQQQWQFFFNPDNVDKMREAVMKQNKTMVTASYNPHHEGFGNRELWEKPGILGVVLANLTSRAIVPAAVNQSTRRTGHAGMSKGLWGTLRQVITNPIRVDVDLGQVIELDALPEEVRTSIQDVEDMLTAVSSSEARRSLDKDRRRNVLETIKKIEMQSELVLMAQAAMLPQESRGVWADRLQQAQPSSEN